MKTNQLYMPEDHMDRLYHAKNPFVGYVHNARLSASCTALPKGKNLKVLDAGCGEGHLIEKMHSVHRYNKYYGVDITEIALKKAKKRCPYADFYNMDLLRLKFKNETFDVVACSEVLEHIYKYDKAINELKRILKREGYLIITFPNETNWIISRFLLMRKPIKVPDHVNSFTPSTIKKHIGLEEVKKENLPFRQLPFFLSLGSLIVFRK